MFSKREETDRLLQAARDVLAKYQPGDVVPHCELSEAIGYSPGESRYYALVRRAREQHCDAGNPWTREVPGVGFRFLTPQEQVNEEQQHRDRRARRQLRIGRSVAEATPDALLSDHERRMKHTRIEASKRREKEILDAERHLKWLGKPPADRPITVRPPRIVKATGTE